MHKDSIRGDRELIADIEMLASGLSAGLTQTQAIKLLANRASQNWRSYFSYLSEEVERAGLALSVLSAKQMAAHPTFDILLELLAIEDRFGNTNLAKTLTNLALRLRMRVAVKTQVIQRINAVKSVGKVAMLAPWLVLIVLSTRTENLAAFASVQGFLVLSLGLALCLVAFLSMNKLGQLPKTSRMFSQ